MGPEEKGGLITPSLWGCCTCRHQMGSEDGRLGRPLFNLELFFEGEIFRQTSSIQKCIQFSQYKISSYLIIALVYTNWETALNQRIYP